MPTRLWTREMILVMGWEDICELGCPTYARMGRDSKGQAMKHRHQRALGNWFAYHPSQWTTETLTAKDRKDFAETLKRLEAGGLVNVERDATNRPVWVQLTDEGIMEAKAVAKRHQMDIGERSATRKLDESIANVEAIIERTKKELSNYKREMKNLPPFHTPHSHMVKHGFKTATSYLKYQREQLRELKAKRSKTSTKEAKA